MLHERSPLIIKIHKIIDFFLVMISFITAYQIKWLLPTDLFGAMSVNPNYYLVLMLIMVVSYATFQFSGLYDSFRDQRFKEILFKIFKAVAISLMIVTFLLYLVEQERISRLLLILFATILTIFLIISKSIIFYTNLYYRRHDQNLKRILIIGSRMRAVELIKAVLGKEDSGYKVIGCLEKIEEADRVGVAVYGNIETIGTLSDYNELLLERTIDEIIFVIPLSEIEHVSDYIHFAEELGVGVRIMPDFQIKKIMYNPENAKISFELFAGVPTISLSSVPNVEGALLFKSFLDYLGASIGLLLLSPLFLIIALLIKLTSNGPVFFFQERSGLNGRKFQLIKFRTMINNAEDLKVKLVGDNEVDGPVFKIQNDPRITSVGKILRKTSLDELPQFINVLRGEMSLVGPRPPLPAEVIQYETWQRRKLSMKPGLTCIWQVGGRNEIDFENWMRMDLEYIDNWSILLDFKILLLTVKEVLSAKGS